MMNMHKQMSEEVFMKQKENVVRQSVELPQQVVSGIWFRREWEGLGWSDNDPTAEDGREETNLTKRKLKC